MSNHIKRLLKKYHLQLVYLPLISEGYLIHTKSKKDLICVKDGLSDNEIEKVVLHEIGHAKNDSSVVGDYSVDYFTRVRCESKANDYMIEEMVKEEASLTYDVSNINYVDFAESLGTHNYGKVRAELAKYIVEK